MTEVVPSINIKANPWEVALSQGDLTRLIARAVHQGVYGDGEMPEGQPPSLAVALLLPRGLIEPTSKPRQRLLATAELGAGRYDAPKALAAADMHFRYRAPRRELPLSCLGSGDVMVGDSVEYQWMIAGGYYKDDSPIAEMLWVMLRQLVEEVNSALEEWEKAQRSRYPDLAWFSRTNDPRPGFTTQR